MKEIGSIAMGSGVAVLAFAAFEVWKASAESEASERRTERLICEADAAVRGLQALSYGVPANRLPAPAEFARIRGCHPPPRLIWEAERLQFAGLVGFGGSVLVLLGALVRNTAARRG